MRSIRLPTAVGHVVPDRLRPPEAFAALAAGLPHDPEMAIARMRAVLVAHGIGA